MDSDEWPAKPSALVTDIDSPIMFAVAEALLRSGVVVTVQDTSRRAIAAPVDLLSERHDPVGLTGVVADRDVSVDLVVPAAATGAPPPAGRVADIVLAAIHGRRPAARAVVTYVDDPSATVPPG
ncbi:hypothetical protein Drose_26485 [Dactylosporangium roseum]|uniref:Uncharacterized protein n=1 Tax=Dactylosporangium roseum TaxID=47989 RepID=A0ABY5Z115_9ACTN|nr:hypothetical protein [Dactylosporangium roseum]UWZ34740.1 hypothetical protein Drose_26485 [Dactylosporangium roseum]